MMMINRNTCLVLLTLLMSCDLIDYSPHEINLYQNEKNLIEKGIKIVQENALKDDTIIFALTGDTQLRLDQVEDFVGHVNDMGNIDFTLICGDLTNFGLFEEFKWLHEELKVLNHPYLPVIGNHDFIANGPKIFKEMYGPFDYSFIVGNFKFVAINTNSIEFGFDGTVPNIGWLKTQLADTIGIKNIFVFSHIMPWSDDFDENLEVPFSSTLAASKVKVSFHGHHHNFESDERYNDGVQYVITGSTGKRSFILIKLWDEGNGIEAKQIFF